jgi:predicted amidohydrolase YtcJ
LDLAFLNGKVITVDPQDSVLEALGVVGNRIAITGTNADVEAFIGENTKVIDLQGRTLMPGINDTHFHPIERFAVRWWDWYDSRGPRRRGSESV